MHHLVKEFCHSKQPTRYASKFLEKEQIIVTFIYILIFRLDSKVFCFQYKIICTKIQFAFLAYRAFQ